MRSKIKQADLPDSYYEHLAGMINEEPPADGNELFVLIGDYILNGSKIKKEEAEKICADISADLINNSLINTENGLSISAEKLLIPITLQIN